MHDLSLSDEIKSHFPHHNEHVVKNLLVVAWSIFEAKSTNLNKAKDSVPKILCNGSDVEENSNYTRLIRFFKEEQTEELLACLLTVCCLFLKPERQKGLKYLVLDGTKWDFGQHSVHLLTLCILWRGVAIPIWWEDIEKAGLSSQEERKTMIINALRRYRLRGMVLLADREYIGEDWFSFLREQGIHFVIRLRAKIYHGQVNASEGQNQSQLQQLAQAQRPGGWVTKKIEIQKHPYRYIIAKNLKTDPKEPLIYLLTSLKRAGIALKAYKMRWKIELCFKHLKTNGFDLEAMNLRGSRKRNLMVGVVVFLYVLAVREGLLAIESAKDCKKTFKIFKKSGTRTLAVSFFRKGVSTLHRKISRFNEIITWLSEVLTGLVRPLWCHV